MCYTLIVNVNKVVTDGERIIIEFRIIIKEMMFFILPILALNLRIFIYSSEVSKFIYIKFVVYGDD